MSVSVLFSLCLLGAAGAFPTDESLPPEQMEKFISDVLFQAKSELVSFRPLPDVDMTFRKVFLGLPIELGIVSHNTTLLGPTSLERYSSVVGSQTPSGSATVRTTIEIGELRLLYPYLLLDFLGLSYEGVAELAVIQPKIDVAFHVYRNVLTECQVSVVTGRPSGNMIFTLGETGGWLRFLMTVIEFVLSRIIVPDWLLEWVFFPDIVPHLEMILQDATKHVACR